MPMVPIVDVLRQLNISPEERTSLYRQGETTLLAVEKYHEVTVKAAKRYGSLENRCVALALGFLFGPQIWEQADCTPEIELSLVLYPFIRAQARKNGLKARWTNKPEELVSIVRRSDFVGGVHSIQSSVYPKCRHAQLIFPGLGTTIDGNPTTATELLQYITVKGELKAEDPIDLSLPMLRPESVISKSLKFFVSTISTLLLLTKKS